MLFESIAAIACRDFSNDLGALDNGPDYAVKLSLCPIPTGLNA